MRELWIEIEESMPVELETFIETAKNSCNMVILSDYANVSSAKAYGVRVASQEGGDISIIDETKIGSMEIYPKPVCLRINIKDRKDEEEAIQAVEKGVDYLAINCPNWKVIPLENLIAKTHGKVKLLAEVTNAEETKIALETLELGADGILVKKFDLNEAMSILKILSEFDREDQGQKIDLLSAKIVKCKQLGIGSRVCIDTCDIMVSGEGMLVGCSSIGLFLVQAEVQENPHVEPRPFRVNAGPVSLYILTPNNVTCYLSELRAGDEVIVVDREGLSRKAIIGRTKIERRPLILVEAKVDDITVKTIVQNAESPQLMLLNGATRLYEPFILISVVFCMMETPKDLHPSMVASMSSE